MKVSTKGRYGLRLLLDVALHQNAGAVSLRDISLRQGISQKYLWQVVNPLAAAGLLRAIRGAQGGYMLARAPKDISIRDIVSILEGSGSVVTCVTVPGTCERSVTCIAREAWAEIETKFNDVMSSITLKDIIQRHKDRESRGTTNLKKNSN